MKKLLITLALVAASIVPAQAQHRHGGHGHHGYRGGHGYGWVAPAIIAGFGTALYLQNQRPVYVEQQPVYVYPPVYPQQPIVQQAPQCPAGYRPEVVFDPSRNTNIIACTQ